MVLFVSFVSLVLQLAAVYFALKLIKISGKASAWGLIAAAIALMALRQGIGLGHLLGAGAVKQPDLLVESVVLVISALMVIGIKRVIDISERTGGERERQSHTEFLASLDRVNRAIQRAGDLDTLMAKTLDEVLAIFDCDRVSLVYPCDADTAAWQVPMQRTKPAYPGRIPVGVEIAMTPEVAAMHREFLHRRQPLVFGADADFPIAPELQAGGDKSGMGTALYPKVGKPWGFSVLQCAYVRRWTPVEQRLFEEIGRRLADGLNSLLMLRDLRASEAKYRRFVDTAHEGILSQDADFRIDFVNAQMAEMLGYSNRELLGHSLDDFTFAEDIADHRRRMEARRQGVSEHYERRLRRKDGSELWTWVSATVINDDKGRFSGSFATLTDITERKRVEKELLDARILFAGVIEQSPVPMALARPTGELIFNKACVEFLHVDDEPTLVPGSKLQEMKQPWKDYDAQGNPMDHTDLPLARALHGEVTKNLELQVVRKDGSRKWEMVTGGPIHDNDGNLIAGFVAFPDITERKEAEEALRNHKAHLEEIVAQRTEELRLARDAAEAANKAKSVFLANMSHELRTPLNAILGFSSLMSRTPDMSDKQRETLEIINRSGEHLLTLINDVLEIAKIEAGKLQLESAAFDLGAMVREVAEMMRLRAEQKGLRLVLDQSSDFPRYIKGDEARLRQILVNLVGNAVKFTAEGGVTIRLGVKDNAGSDLLLEVEDTGPGIGPEQQECLFQPFVQLGEDAARSGTGLGLAIARQFAHLMGGDIAVESEPGRGARFRVELPLEQVSEDEVRQSGASAHGEVVELAPGQPGYRILIAEDQPENRQLLERLMVDLGLEVKTAGNGEHCLRIFEDWHPHLIWMDQRMPVMDGLEAARRIRRLPNGKAVKIVAVTASVFKEEQSEMLAAGIDELIRKPFRFGEIYDCMTRQLGVEFIRRANAEAPGAPREPLIPEQLAVLPTSLRGQFREALMMLDGRRIEEIVGRIAAIDAKLGAILSGLVEYFEYPVILAALDAVDARHA